MAGKKASFAGRLRKPIHLGEAKPRGLKAAFALPPDADDMIAYAKSELQARYAELDQHFGLRSEATDIWEQRLRVLLSRVYKIPPNDSRWAERLVCRLACQHIPGFELKLPGDSKFGAPREWTDEKLAQLFADVEYLKKATGKSVREICKSLPRSAGYSTRWGAHKQAGLTKEYSQANKRFGKDLEFHILLCNSPTMSGNRDDSIDVAIEMHALKKPLSKTRGE
jgi:hypothetical protein